MSKAFARRATLTLAIAITASTIARSAHAQDRKEYERAVDSARAAMDSLSAQMAVLTRQYRVPLSDTLRVGVLTVITEPKLHALAERAARQAIDSMTAVVGVAINRLASHPLVLRPIDSMATFGVVHTPADQRDWQDKLEDEGLPIGRPASSSSASDAAVRTAVLDSMGRETMATMQFPTADAIAHAWTSEATQLVARAMPPSFRLWAGPDMPLYKYDDQMWTIVRFQAIDWSIDVVRRCIAADMSACSVALGLTPVVDTLATWFDDAEREEFARQRLGKLDGDAHRSSWKSLAQARAYEAISTKCFFGIQMGYSRERWAAEFVQRWAGPACVLVRGADSAYYASRHDATWSRAEACLDAKGTVAACDSFRGDSLFTNTSAPLSIDVRRSVVREALTLGGAGAYERLLESHGTPGEQLAAAAGVPLDSVLRSWQHRVMTTNLKPKSLDTGTVASSLFWILVCGTLALRSSKWR